MKFSTLIVFFILIISTSYSQVKLRGGMGVDYVSAPSLYDYFNQNFSQPNSQVGSFAAAVNFSAEADYPAGASYEIGLDFAYRLYSYNNINNLGKYNLGYHNLMPTLVNYYVINGEGYQFKFGGGVGARFLTANETLPSSPSTQTYTSAGIGFLLRAAGNTKISTSFYANILIDIRYDLNGEPKNNGTNLYNPAMKNKVNFNSFSAGVGLGITYYL